MTLLINTFIHILHVCIYILVDGTLNSYQYIPFFFTKDTLSAKALIHSTATMHDVFKCLVIHAYASTMIGNIGTQ